ncbi:XAC0095 family protein, partial [Dyella monticola]
ELKSIQGMLALMARIAHNDESEASGDATLTISRALLSYYFMEISAQMGEALDRVGKENVIGKQNWMWQ